MNTLIRSLTALSLLIPPLLTQAQAGPDSVLAELELPENRAFIQPRDRLALSLSDRIAPELRASIHLELNNVDVSGLVQWRPQALRYQPVRPLPAGEHELRLMYYGEDGSVQELGYWRFEVRQSASFKTASVQSHSELSLNQRVMERHRTGAPDFSARGYSQWLGELESDRWRFEGSAELAYANRLEQSITGRRLDMPQFSVLAESERVALAAGHQIMGQTSLVMDGYQQRGLGSEVQLDALNSQIKLFGMSGSRELGVDGGLGLNDRDNRVTGSRWQSQWQPGEGAELHLSSTYLSGRISEPDRGSWEPEPQSQEVNDGHAWNAVLDGFLFERALRLRWEHATSRYDFDGRDFGFDAVTDNAWSALALIDPAPTAWETPLDWRLGLEAKKVGTFYRSLAHQYLPADKYLRSAFASATRDKWHWDTRYAHEESNLDEDPDYAITETRHWTMQLGYSDYDRPEPGGLSALLGQPSYQLSLNRLEREDDTTPAGYLPNDLTTEGVQATANFMRERWHWSLGVGLDELTDHTGWQPDTETRHVSWQAGIDLSRRYRLDLGWQADRTRYRDGGERVDQQLYSFGGQAQILPGTLSLSLSLGLNQNNAEDDPYFAQKQESLYTSGQLDWRIREPANHKFGFDLGLSVSRNALRDRLTASDPYSEHQLWLELRTTLPTATHPASIQGTGL